MEGPETIVARLDLEFDQVLADMKPHVMRLPHKSGLDLLRTKQQNVNFNQMRSPC